MKKKLFWAANFLVLGLFTAYALTGFFGVNSSKAYAATLAKDGFYKQGDNFMVVDHSGTGVHGGTQGQQEICMLSSEQVGELDAFFTVDTFDLKVQNTNVKLAAVSGRRLTKQQLMDYLHASDATLQCRIVEQQHVFFFPVLPQVS